MTTSTLAVHRRQDSAPGDEVPSHKPGRKSFRPSDILGMLKQTGANWMEDRAMRLAAALSLYTILSLAPLLVISVRVASLVLSEEAAQNQVADQIQGLVGRAGAEAVQDMIKAAAHPEAGNIAVLISFVVLLFTASGVFTELQDSMNTIWEVKPKPARFWDVVRDRLFSMAMVFAVIFLLLVSLVVSTILLWVSNRLGGGGWTGYLIDLGVSLVVITVLFAMILRYVPDVRLGWGDVMLGAAVTAVLFKLGQIGLGLYFKHAAPTSAYGAAGSFAAVLLWAYYSSMIFFFGAEFTQVYARRAGHRIHAAENAVPVTDEERAQQGLVTKDDVQAATELMAAAEEIRTGKPRVVVCERRAGAAQWAIAACGIAAGALLGLMGLRNRERTAIRSVALDTRLARMERRLQRGDRPHSVSERIDEVRRRIRRGAPCGAK